MWQNSTEGWNFFFAGWGTQPALGPLATMQLLIQPNAAYKPKDGKDDPDLLAAWIGMNMLPTPDGRHEAFGRMQGLVLDKVYAIPFGSFTAVQGVRSNVNGFVPFPVARMANVWLGR
jgi:peptide/nickel transport system substrate-binding protein